MDIWSWNNAVDAAGTLVSSSTGPAGDLVEANIRDPRVAKIFRADATPCDLSVALGASGAVSIFGLFGVNFASLGTVTLKLGTAEGSDDLWSYEIDPNVLPLETQGVFVLDAAVEPSYATVSVSEGDPLEVGRIWLGAADWEPTRSHTYDGSRWGYDDLSLRSRTQRSGAYLIDRGSRLRTFTAAYNGLAEADYATALPIMDRRGLAQQMLFIPTTDTYDPHEFAVLGYLADMPSTAWRTLALAERALTINEAG